VCLGIGHSELQASDLRHGPRLIHIGVSSIQSQAAGATAFSAAESRRHVSGKSERAKKTIMPIETAMDPSTMSNHCQAAKPRAPDKPFRMPAAIRLPKTSRDEGSRLKNAHPEVELSPGVPLG